MSRQIEGIKLECARSLALNAAFNAAHGGDADEVRKVVSDFAEKALDLIGNALALVTELVNGLGGEDSAKGSKRAKPGARRASGCVGSSRAGGSVRGR